MSGILGYWDIYKERPMTLAFQPFLHTPSIYRNLHTGPSRFCSANLGSRMSTTHWHSNWKHFLLIRDPQSKLRCLPLVSLKRAFNGFETKFRAFSSPRESKTSLSAAAAADICNEVEKIGFGLGKDERACKWRTGSISPKMHCLAIWMAGWL